MKRSRKSAWKNYRQWLAAGMSEYLPAPVFSFFARTPGLRWAARMLVFTAILMAWDDATTLRVRFGSARRVVTEMFPTRLTVGKTYQGFIQRLLSLQGRLLQAVTIHLQAELQRMA